MNIVAVVHARSGSKRIPLKNMKMLAGKPLVAYIIEAACRAKMVKRVIVSSDHPAIIETAKQYGAEAPFVRPADISEDVPSELVTRHAVKYLQDKEGYWTDIAVTLQPTTPFCSPEDIDSCVRELIDSGADSVISGCAVRQRPEWMFYMDKDNYARNFLAREIKGETGVSQSLPKLYSPNGGVYATRRDVLFEQNSLFGKKIKIWVMPFIRSVDIDEPIDFAFAEFIAEGILAGKEEKYA